MKRKKYVLELEIHIREWKFIWKKKWSYKTWFNSKIIQIDKKQLSAFIDR